MTALLFCVNVIYYFLQHFLQTKAPQTSWSGRLFHTSE